MTEPQPGGVPGIEGYLRRTQARSFPRHHRNRGAPSDWHHASVEL